MKRKTLRVIEGKNKTVILKTPKPILCAIAIVSLILIAVLPFCIDKVLEIIRLKEAKALVFFIVYTVCVVSNLAIIVRLFLEKTVLDTQKKQLLLYTPFCHTKNFSDIADIEVFHVEKGPEVDEVSKVILHLTDGKKILLPVSGKAQADELSALLKKLMSSEEN